MLIVAAIGGNAVLRKGEKPTIEKQFRNAAKLMQKLAGLAKKHRLVLTHGNGPQVGNILIRSEEAAGKAYPLPLYACVAESQGEMGFMMEQTLQNEFRKRGIKKPVISILTQVVVDKNDPLFNEPTKAIGPFYSGKEANALRKKRFNLAKDPRGGYRRVVSSPKPKKIVEAETIKELVNHGITIIAAGGGGIPVYEDAGLHAIEAVIDKDLASACLATSIGADMLLIITDVQAACLNYRKPGQKEIRKMKVRQAMWYMKEGHFPQGSMGPKVQAAMNFLNKGGKKAVITNENNIFHALEGRAGTTIIR